MIDTAGERIERMEVYVSTIVDVSGCKTAKEAYRLSKIISEKMTDALSEHNIIVNDIYEVFRDKNDDIADEQDEE